MIDITRVYTTTPVTTPSSSTVTQTLPVADKTQEIQQKERRHKKERRDKRKKSVIERRVSSDRRKPLFDAEA